MAIDCKMHTLFVQQDKKLSAKRGEGSENAFFRFCANCSEQNGQNRYLNSYLHLHPQSHCRAKVVDVLFSVSDVNMTPLALTVSRVCTSELSLMYVLMRAVTEPSLLIPSHRLM